MAGNLNREMLHQQWMHSREEDTDTEMVFRPASYDFPPARGRTGFELRPDGTLVEIGIGPTDRRQETEGTWQLEGDDQIALHRGGQSGAERTLRVVSVDKDRLIVRK